MTQSKEIIHEKLGIVHVGLHIRYETGRNIVAMDARTWKILVNTTDLLVGTNIAPTVASFDIDRGDSGQRRLDLCEYKLPWT